MAESEEIGHFMTGMDPSDWTLAKWLAAPDDVTKCANIYEQLHR